MLASDEFARKHGIDRPVYIAAQAMTTDYPSSFEEHSMIKMVGYDMAKTAAKKLYEQTGIGPDDLISLLISACNGENSVTACLKSTSVYAPASCGAMPL